MRKDLVCGCHPKQLSYALTTYVQTYRQPKGSGSVKPDLRAVKAVVSHYSGKKQSALLYISNNDNNSDKEHKQCQCSLHGSMYSPDYKKKR